MIRAKISQALPMPAGDMITVVLWGILAFILALVALAQKPRDFAKHRNGHDDFVGLFKKGHRSCALLLVIVRDDVAEQGTPLQGRGEGKKSGQSQGLPLQGFVLQRWQC